MTYVREGCADWTEATQGIIAFGRVGRAFKPLVQLHGWDAVRPAWRHYLEITPIHYASPERFAATFGEWVVRPKPVTPPPVWRSVLEGQRYRLVREEP